MNNYSISRVISFGLFGIIGSFTTIPIIPIQAQNIAPANTNTTNTVVNLTGNQFDISGGASSADGSNLFHDFQRFGLDAAQIANFLATPNIQNILGRVSGGEASLINGLIQVTGGNSNLYLMNPTGIVFGPNASLNVPASFSATTSSAIGFAGGIFKAVGDNDFTALDGNPTRFIFSLANPSGVINAANLAVTAGNNLNLVGGTVINTGTLNATNTGNVSIVAVPGSSLVRITPTGSLLSIEVDASQLANGIKTLTLPDILNAANTATINTGVTDNAGQLTVTSSGTNVNQGDIVTNGNLTSDNLRLSVAGTGNIVADQSLTINSSLTTESANGNTNFKGTVTTAALKAGTLTTTSNGTIQFADFVGGDVVAKGSGVIGFTSITAASLDTTAQSKTQLGGNVFTTGKQTYGNLQLDAANISLSTNGNEIKFNGTVDSKAGLSSNLSIDSPTGANITFTGKVGSVTTALGDIKTTTAGLTDFKDTVNAGIIKSDGFLGRTAFGGAVNAISVDTKAQATTQISANITTTGSQAYGGAVTLANNPTLTGRGIVFNGTVNGANQNLTVNSGTGDLEFKAAVGTVANPLGTVTTNAATTTIGNTTFNATQLAVTSTNVTNINGNIGTTGSQTYTGAVNLANNPTLTGQGIAFDGIVNGANQNLTVNGGISNIEFKAAVGTTNPLGNITTTTTGLTDFKNTINAGIIKSDGTSGSTAFGGNVNAISVDTKSQKATQISANITTTGTQAYGGAVTLANNPILTGQGISFDGTVNGATQNLTVNSGTGNLEFKAAVGTQANPLGAITTNAATTTIGDNIGDDTVNATQLAVTSTTATNLNANITTSDSQTYTGAVNLTNNPTLTGKNITFNDKVNGANQNLTANSTGNLEFKDKVGSTSSLGAITTTADTTTIGGDVTSTKLEVTSTKVTNLNANVITTGSQSYTGAVNLANNPVLIGKGITFDGAVDSKAGSSSNLSISSSDGANITFTGKVGSVNTLGNITTTTTGLTDFKNTVNAGTIKSDGASGSTAFGGNVTATSVDTKSQATTKISANIATTGTQNYGGEVTLANNPTLTGQAITFDGTVNGANQNLTVNSGSGTATFRQQIGNTAALTSLTTTGSKVELNANVTTTGNQTFNSALVELMGNGDRRLSSANGSIQIANVLDAKAINLTLSSSEINFNGGDAAVRGTGTLTLETSTSNRPIVLGGTDNIPSALTLTSQDLASIKGDFAALTIGRSDSTANVSVDASGITLKNPLVTIQTGQTGTGAIAINGNVQNSGSLDLKAPLVNLGGNLTASGNILITGATQLSGINRSVNAVGNITFQQTVTGLATNFAATSAAQLNFNSTVSLLSLLANANQVNLNGNISTSANQTYNAPVFLTNDVAIAGDSLFFNSSIDANSRFLTINAVNNITAQGIASQGRNVTLVSNGGVIKTGNISTGSGNVSEGGKLSITTTSNLIDTGAINTSGTAIGGAVDLKVSESGSSAVGEIKTGDINTNSNQQGGSVTLGAGQTITTGAINSSSTSGAGGTIGLTAGQAITTGGINSSSISGAGGSVSLIARQTITTREINSSSTQGKAGNVIIDPLKFTFDYINAEGGTTGGNVAINFDDANTFRGLLLGTATFSSSIVGNNQVTISTAGRIPGGGIDIKHTGTIDAGGGRFVTNNPFRIGGGNLETGNGTIGAITTGSVTLFNEIFFDSFTLGNLQILTGSGISPTSNIAQAASVVSGVQSSRINNVSTIKDFVESIEDSLREEFKQVGILEGTNKTFEDIKEDIKYLEQVSGTKTAVLYLGYQPRQYLDSSSAEVSIARALITSQTKSGDQNLPPEETINTNLDQFIRGVEDNANRKDRAEQNLLEYQKFAKSLYDVIFTDNLKNKLNEQKIETVIIVTSGRLRSVPFAALYDGKEYLIEKYNISSIPSLSLSDFREVKPAKPIEPKQVLAMGMSDFTKFPELSDKPLDNVPSELGLITKEGKYYLNNEFTQDNLRSLRQKFEQNVLHIATHAVISQNPQFNGIYFWDDKLPLAIDSFRSLKLGKADSQTKAVDLLVLSACQTADDDPKSRLAFAGLARSAGVNTVVATLWEIADESTPKLMDNFYSGLRQGASISGSLRKAQVKMLKSQEYAHPFYWAAFTLIGNP
ncbi:CHAT domain-containing protein [Pseudanabaena sp. FACHB-1277]|uniref:CHAT domain-containing protein n=1 Tax=Pseudanabaena cinerea FACHB-1277 TaxID=2949581 RepID=A0A926Z783_9CYAN|nr:CHAT domain-containing protein [Pseudanabaena cinerea]MBD2151806.1 CHAT domain-containing protein [Pseudanabaena cinerea FACHB-1277]